MRFKQLFLIAWAMILLYTILRIAISMGYSVPGGLILPLLFIFVFGLMLCALRYGKKDAVIFFVIVFATGWLYETCSILTGFPFGHYYYSDILGPKIWLVPILVMLLYFSMGYMSWTLAHIILGKYDNAIGGRELFLIPLVSTFIMVIWDMSMDPNASTISGQWVWQTGGPYFGVPFSNFLGWFLCVFTFYAIFAVYVSKKKSNPFSDILKEKMMWQLPVAGYFLVALCILFSAIYGANYLITSPDGHVWWTSDIRWSLVLVTMFTMLFVVVISLIRLYDSDLEKLNPAR